MRGGALPPALLCAAFALALAFAPRRAAPLALLVMVAVAVAVSFVEAPSAWLEPIFLGCWLSVIIAALAVHVPGGLGSSASLVLAVNTGVWAGAVVSAAGDGTDLVKATPLALLCLPAGWLVHSRRAIVVKIVASWLVAVALLAAALPLTPTPGYEPDHMD